MNIDWELLAKQKLHLLELIEYFEEVADDAKVQHEPLYGILHLIDAIQDEAAERGEPVVFLTEE